MLDAITIFCVMLCQARVTQSVVLPNEYIRHVLFDSRACVAPARPPDLRNEHRV